MTDIRQRVDGTPHVRAWLTQQLVLPKRDNPDARQFWSMLDQWDFHIDNKLTLMNTKEDPRYYRRVHQATRDEGQGYVHPV